LIGSIPVVTYRAGSDALTRVKELRGCTAKTGGSRVGRACFARRIAC